MDDDDGDLFDIDLSTGLSVDEYLDRTFDPECELLGGETRPKPLGTGTHSKMQKRLTRLLESFFGESRVQFELSMIIGADIVFPDVLVLIHDHPAMHRDVLNEAPLLCIEVLSPSQRPAEMLAKCETYRDFGVPFCWVIDPVGKHAWEYHLSHSGPREVVHVFTEPCPLLLEQIFGD